MTTTTSIGWIRTTSLRGYSYFVLFTGRYAYGRPDNSQTS